MPGYFAQTHTRPELIGRPLVQILWEEHARNRGAAMSALRRYELEREGDQPFGKLSGGQQARFQILLLELAGATALLLDEPTDNLDLESAEALQDGLASYRYGFDTSEVTVDRIGGGVPGEPYQRSANVWAFDFDLARPGTRLVDIIQTLRYWAPLAAPADRDPAFAGQDVPARIALFCEAYGLSYAERARLVPVAVRWLRRSRITIAERAERGGEAWARMLDAGGGERLVRAADWLEQCRPEIEARLRRGGI